MSPAELERLARGKKNPLLRGWKAANIEDHQFQSLQAHAAATPSHAAALDPEGTPRRRNSWGRVGGQPAAEAEALCTTWQPSPLRPNATMGARPAIYGGAFQRNRAVKGHFPQKISRTDTQASALAPPSPTRGPSRNHPPPPGSSKWKKKTARTNHADTLK